MPLDANPIRERIVNQLFVIFPAIQAFLILQSSERNNLILRKKKFWRRNPICRQFFGDPIECDAGAVRFPLSNNVDKYSKKGIFARQTVELDRIRFDAVALDIAGKCWGWSRCPGLVLLDVFNVECSKVSTVFEVCLFGFWVKLMVNWWDSHKSLA